MVAWPAVVAKLVAVLPTLTVGSARVYDGPYGTADPGDLYVTVGYDETSGGGQGGTFTQRPSLMGPFTDEAGTVVSYFASQSGDDLLLVRRSQVFDWVGNLQAWLTDNPTLGGVLATDGTVEMDTAVGSLRNSQGVAQALIVTVTYTTRT